MARLVLVESKSTETKRPANVPEGLLAKQLLEKYGYVARTINAKNGQFEFPCPFHEEPGLLPKGKPTNFYLNAKTSQFYCQAASCSESGNLQILEKYFGIESDPALSARYRSKDTELKEFQGQLTEDKRDYLRMDKGLTDEVIDRFRVGYHPDKQCYVIPYLEQRRPVAFRFYDPHGVTDEAGETVTDEKGRVVYRGPNGSKYWWEVSDNSIVNTDDEAVLRLFNPAAAGGDMDNGRVFICEGELKAMLLAGHGYAAVSIPGASSFKHEWARYFMHAKEVVILMDNDNPEGHKRERCHKCDTANLDDCVGHNPGQEAAAKLTDFFGFRARNVVLPLPEGERKTDINEYLVRDDHTFSDFEVLAFGQSSQDRYRVRTLGEIRLDPPPEAVFLVNDLLPRGGRLLVTGAPKVGKSIFIENLVLSIAAGIPFLHRFGMSNDGLVPGHRVLLLDRELSERSLFDRMNQLSEERRGYQVAQEKLFIDHKFKVQLDAANAANNLKSLVNSNGIEVIVLDTAYKFFSGDIESSTSVKKAFATLDELIAETGVSIILTHHHRKGANSGRESVNSDQVAGSFLWTGWPNGTVLLNFKNRSVQDPYTTVASFVAFRDCAAPDPLLLKRDKNSIAYREILSYSHDDTEFADSSQNSSHNGQQARPKLNYDALADLLIKQVPTEQGEFLHQASAHFGMRDDNVRVVLLDILDRHPDFVREGKGSTQSPYIWRYKHDRKEETYEEEQAALGQQIPGQTTIEEMLG